jgi:hypothetical protein
MLSSTIKPWQKCVRQDSNPGLKLGRLTCLPLHHGRWSVDRESEEKLNSSFGAQFLLDPRDRSPFEYIPHGSSIGPGKGLGSHEVRFNDTSGTRECKFQASSLGHLPISARTTREYSPGHQREEPEQIRKDESDVDRVPLGVRGLLRSHVGRTPSAHMARARIRVRWCGSA